MTKEEKAKIRRAWRKRFLAEEKLLQAKSKSAYQAAKKCARLLASQFGVEKVYLFGSTLNECFHKKSDIDLAVEGLPHDKYFTALSKLMVCMPEGMEVDLIPLEDAVPSLKKVVSQDGELIYGKK